MALWNDKRTPKGVITNSGTGQSGPLPSSVPASRAPSARSAAVTPQAGMNRISAPVPSAGVQATAVRQTRVAPRGAKPIGKVPVDGPSRPAAKKEVSDIARVSKVASIQKGLKGRPRK